MSSVQRSPSIPRLGRLSNTRDLASVSALREPRISSRSKRIQPQPEGQPETLEQCQAPGRIGRRLCGQITKGAEMTSNNTRTMSVAVVGGGIGGIAAATMLKRAGYTDVTVFERNTGLGGVWHTNTYPGAACDVPSHFYEFSFSPNPDWSRRDPAITEINWGAACCSRSCSGSSRPPGWPGSGWG